MNRIINLHAISDPVWMEKTIVLLKKKFNMISPQDLLEFYFNGKKLSNSCLITVDDGDETFYTVIYPVLKRHHVPAILFVSPMVARRENISNFWFQEIRNCPVDKFKVIAQSTVSYTDTVKDDDDFMGNYVPQFKIDDIWTIIHQCKKECDLPYFEPRNMTVEQICEVDREGLVTIGAHTMWHPLLAREEDKRSEWEIKQSVKELSEMLGHEIIFFAYPNGRKDVDFSQREMTYVSQTTCRLAFSTQHKGFTLQSEQYAVPRFGLTCGKEWFIRLKLLLGEHYHSIRKALRTLKHINRAVKPL